MSIQLRHAVNAKRGAHRSFLMEMAREPGRRGAPPAEEGEPGPRRPLAPRTNPANNAPSQRAAQLPGRGPGRGHKGTHAAGVAGRVGRLRGKLAAQTRLRPRPQNRASRGQRGREIKGGSGWGGRVGRRWRRRRGPREVERRLRGLGLGGQGHPAGWSERRPRCWRRVALRERSATGFSQQCPEGHSPQPRRVSSCHGYDGRVR